MTVTHGRVCPYTVIRRSDTSRDTAVHCFTVLIKSFCAAAGGVWRLVPIFDLIIF